MIKLLLLITIIGGLIYGKGLPHRQRIMASEVHKQKLAEIKAKENASIPTTDEVLAEIARVFGPEGKAVVLQAIQCFYSESKWNAIALNKNTNGTFDAGIAQINDVHRMTIPDRFDYKKNIQKAYEIYKDSGWNPWYAKLCR